MHSRIWYSHLHTHVNDSTIHNSQALETAQLPHNWWMQENIVYIHNRVLFSHKGWNSVVCR
jgi:hypothetical protein